MQARNMAGTKFSSKKKKQGKTQDSKSKRELEKMLKEQTKKEFKGT